MTRLIMVSMALLTATLSASAQSADDRELMQYRLTTEVLTRAEAVAAAFSANVGKDPAMKRRLDAQRELAVLEDKDTLTAAEQSRIDQLQEIVGDDWRNARHAGTAGCGGRQRQIRDLQSGGCRAYQ